MGNMAKMRKAAGLTQQTAAKALAVDCSTVAKWETGEAVPRAPKLPKLAALYGVSLEELMNAIFEKRGA